VHGRLADGTQRTYDVYAQCTDCEQIYWRGAHHARLNAIVEEAMREFGPHRPSSPALPSQDAATAS
jgi:hypothetical protein